MYDKMAIVRIVNIFGGNRAPAPDGLARQPDWVAWFSDAEDMRTLHGEGIEYTFAYKLGQERQVKTVTSTSVGPEDLKPGEEALCVDTTFSLEIAYKSRVDLVMYRNDPRFVPALHHGGASDEIISARIQLTLNFIEGAKDNDIDLTVARLLFGFMEGARYISRVDLEGKIGNMLNNKIRQEIQTFLIGNRCGGADLEARANPELRDYLNEKYFTRNDGEKLPMCLEVQGVIAQVWTS